MLNKYQHLLKTVNNKIKHHEHILETNGLDTDKYWAQLVGRRQIIEIIIADIEAIREKANKNKGELSQCKKKQSLKLYIEK